MGEEFSNISLADSSRFNLCVRCFACAHAYTLENASVGSVYSGLDSSSQRALMSKMLGRSLVGLLAGLLCCSGIAAQSAQPTNQILFRTLMIKSKYDAGTMFSIEVDSREYWLTAKHILTGRKSGPAGEVNEKTVSLDVLDPIGDTIKWNTDQFSVIDPGKDVDIVILVPATDLLPGIPLPSLKVSSGSYGMGEECSFLGFPYANTWTAIFSTSNPIPYKMPYIKHCYISGIIRQPSPILVLDGINNPGFSGGPVLYHTGTDQVVIGVISGYHNEPGEVHSIEVPDTPTAVQTPESKKPTRKMDVVDLNSGIIVAVSANVAVDAIRKNPIGRPVEAK